MTEQQGDTCDSCRFDADRWSDGDTVRTITTFGQLVPLWAAPIPYDERNSRLNHTTWSVNEYVDHMRETVSGMRFVAELAAAEPGHDLGPEIEPAGLGLHRPLDFDEVLAGLVEATAQLSSLLRAMAKDQQSCSVVIGGRHHSIRWAAQHAVHDVWHHLTDIAAIAVASGHRPANAMGGTVERINRSSGGVPKTAVSSAEVTYAGVEGDRQKTRRHHGRPWQALCLWSGNVIDALQAEGHPIEAGFAGENLTLRGFDWSQLHAGDIVRFGTVRAQLSAPAVPCAQNTNWFTAGDFQRMSHDLHPGWSRWYASVLDPGSVTVGDPAAIGTV